jgi:hypothetical protein
MGVSILTGPQRAKQFKAQTIRNEPNQCRHIVQAVQNKGPAMRPGLGRSDQGKGAQVSEQDMEILCPGGLIE